MQMTLKEAVSSAIRNPGLCACMGPGETGTCPCGRLFDYKVMKDGTKINNPSVPRLVVQDIFTTKNKFNIRLVTKK